jgi:hypothetical protein
VNGDSAAIYEIRNQDQNDAVKDGAGALTPTRNDAGDGTRLSGFRLFGPSALRNERRDAYGETSSPAAFAGHIDRAAEQFGVSFYD